VAEPRPASVLPAGRLAWTRTDVAWLALALVATALVFARSLSGELVYDDLLLVARNPDITSLANLPRHFLRAYWDFVDSGSPEQTGYWRPLSAVAHSVAWALGGGSPVAFHTVCVLAHLVACGAAFRIARRLGASAMLAGLVALLFGLHPTHVESVAWISALNDPLFGAFALLSLAAYLRWRQAGSRGSPLLAAVFFAASLLSKEMGMAVPPLLLALDLGRPREVGEPPMSDGRFGGLHAWKRALLPFAIVLGLYYLARVLVFDEIAAGLHPTTHFGVGPLRLALLRLELVGGSLRLLAWPVALNAFRPFRPEVAASDPELLVAGLATMLALALLAWLFLRRIVPELAAGLSVLAGLSPVLVSVGSLGRFPLSDRFLYVPVLGFVLLLALLLRRYVSERVAGLVLGLVAILYGARSFERIAVWHDEHAFFSTAARESPRSPYVLWGYGRVLADQYERTRDPAVLSEYKAVVDRAAALLDEAKETGSDLFVTSEDYLQVNLEIGWYYTFEAQSDEYGSYATAIAIFEELARRVGELEDEKRDARSLGIRVSSGTLDLELVYAALGTVYRLAGRLADAQTALEKALTLDPRELKAHRELGRVFAEKGEWKLAIRHLEEALALAPRDPETELALAQACREGKELERAESLARGLLDRPETAAEAALVLGAVRLDQRDAREALVWVERALEADPDLGHAWYLKAKALLLAGVNEEATIQAFRRATELDPGAFDANYDFGAFLLQKGAPDAAIPFLVRAYALASDPRLAAGLYRTLAGPELPYESPEPLFELARVEIGRGRWDVAESWFDRALVLDPEHGPSLFGKGRVLRRLGRDEEALDLMRRGCERMPDDFVAQSELGLYLVDLGRAAEASPYLERALALEPPPDWHPDVARDMRSRIERALASSESP
jgi:tetratricopeptide (TPR) repeat protein